MLKKKNKPIILVMMLSLIFLLMITSVNAAENDFIQNDTISADISVDEVQFTSSVDCEETLSEADTVIYISPTGSSSGSGTRSNPYDSLSTAINHIEGKTEIILMDGTYTMSRNTNFNLNKNDVTIRADEGATPIISISSETSSKWQFSGKNYVVDGITFTDEYSTYSSYSLQAIYGSSVTNMTITNCTIQSKWKDKNLIYFTGTNNNITIENCTIRHLNSNSVDKSPIYFSGTSSKGINIINNTIDSFHATVNGGAIYIEKGKEIVIENNTIKNVDSTQNGGVIFFSSLSADDQVIIRNNKFYNTASKNNYGGAIYATSIPNRVKFYIENNTFENSLSVNYGGALYIKGSYFQLFVRNNTFNNISFTKSSANGYGAVLYAYGCNMYFEDNNVTNVKSQQGSVYYESPTGTVPLRFNNNHFSNCSSSQGSIIYSKGFKVGDTIYVENNTFENSFSRDSGALYFPTGNNHNLIIKNNTFYNLTSVNYGGAIYTNSFNVNITDNNFTNCTCKDIGGAIYLSGNYNPVANVLNNSFINCSADKGGAIYSSSYILNADNNEFINCSANSSAGAIYAFSAYDNQLINISNSTFINNSAPNGGAIVFEAYNYNVTNCEFENNTGEYGGAILLNLYSRSYPYYSAVQKVINNTFTGNNAEFGGSIYSYIINDLTMQNNTFIDNNATIGGAVFLDYPRSDYGCKKIVIDNCTFENNTAYSGAGLIVYMPNAIVANSTFINNNASRYGGGALLSGGKNNTVFNNTFKNNTAFLYGGAIGANNTYIANNTFINNSAYQGGAILTINSKIAYNNFTDNNATRGKDIVYIDTYEYYTTTVKCNCTNCTDCDCTMENCNCTNASMIEIIEDLLIDNIMEDGTVYKYDEKEILRVDKELNGKYFLYKKINGYYREYYYWGYCIEQNNSVPLNYNGTLGIHVDDLTFVRNSLDQSYVGDYIKVLLILYQKEIYNLKDYIYVFTDGDYLNSDNEIIKTVINVTNDEFTHLENGNNYVNGTFSCYWFSTFINPTSRQNLILINGCAPIKIVDMQVSKDASSSTVKANSDIEYEISVYNSNTNITLTNITVTDILGEGDWYIKDWVNTYNDKWIRTGENTWTLNRPLYDGEIAKFKVICHVNSIEEGSLVNTAQVFSHETGYTSVSESVKTETGSLIIRKIATTSKATSGDVISYKIVVTNNGDTRSGTIKVREMLPSTYYATYLGWSSDVGSWYQSSTSSSELEFTLSSYYLNPGQSASFYVFFKSNPDRTGYVYNNAQLYENSKYVDSANDYVELVYTSFGVKKTGPDRANVGEYVTFEVVVNYYSYSTNVPLTGVYVEDIIPDGLEYYSSYGEGWSYRGSAGDNKHKWVYLYPLTSSKSYTDTLYITCKVTEAGAHTNKVNAYSETLGPVTSTHTVTGLAPGISVYKRAGTGNYYVGDLIPFYIDITNSGDTYLSGIVLHEEYFEGLEFAYLYDPSHIWQKIEGTNSWKTYVGLPYNGWGISSTLIYFRATENGTFYNIVNVTTDQGVSDEASAQVHVLNKEITGEKLVSDKVINNGTNVTFTINVKNTYTQALTNVYVEEHPDDGLTLEGWVPIKGDWSYNPSTGHYELAGSIAVDDYASFNITYRADKFGTLNNTIYYKCDQSKVFTTVNSTFVQNPSMEILKIPLKDIVFLGDEVGFKIQVKNNGNMELSHIFINETSFEGLNFTRWENTSGHWSLSKNNGKYRFILLDHLASGDDASFIVYFNTTQTGKLKNIIVGGSDKTNDSEVNNTTLVVKQALKIEKITVTPVVPLNNLTTFIINVTNIGEETLDDVIVRELSHTGLDYLSFKPIKGDWSYEENVFKLKSELIVDDWAAFNITFNATQAGNRLNIVQGTYNHTINVTANNTTRIIAPSMKVQKLSLNKTVNFGDNVTFTIVVTNNGDYDLSNVVVSESEFEGLINPRFVPDKGNWIKDGNSYKLSDVLKIAESASFNITFTANKYGNLTNVVLAKSNLTHEIKANNTTFVQNPNMTVVKITLNQNVSLGNPVTFQIIVNNTGNIPLTNVFVNETNHTGLINPIHNNINGTWTFENGVYKLSGALAVGKSASFNITFVADEIGELRNTVVAGSLESKNKSANNTTFVEYPDLSIVKLTLNKTVRLGENVTFTINVTNTGNINLSKIYVNEFEQNHPGLKYATFVSNNGTWTGDGVRFNLTETLKPGQSASFNITFTTTTSGRLRNTAIAGSNETSTKEAQNDTFCENYDFIVEKKTLNPVVLINNEVIFEIYVKNIGNMELTNISINESEHDGLDYIGYINGTKNWKYENGLFVLDSLAIGDDATVQIRFNATKQSQLNNTVIVKTNESTQKEANNTTYVLNPLLSVEKITVNESVLLGENVVFTIIVKNIGNVNLTDVYVKETDFRGLEYQTSDDVVGEWTYGKTNNVFKLTGPLNVGKNATFNVTFKTTQIGQLNNTVVAGSNESDEKSANNTTFVRNPVLDVRKITVNETVYNGEEVIFTIFVENNGNVALGDVTVQEFSFDGLEYIGYVNDTGNWKYENNIFTLIGTLDIGANATFNVTFKANRIGNLTNIVMVKSNDTEDKKVNNTTEVLPFIDLEVIKLVSNSTAKLGDVITWTVIVKNNGLDEVRNVIVKDEFSGDLIFINATGNYANNAWIIDSIPAGKNVTLTINSRVNATNKTITNIALIDENHTATNNTTVAPLCDVVITKLVDADIHIFGDNITWTVIVENKGPDAALNVIVEDILSDNLTLLKVKESKGQYLRGIWTVGNLTSGEKANITFVTTAKYSNITINNTAKVNTTTPESNYTNNNATNKTAIINPNMTVQKITVNETVRLGEEVTFTIIVKNTGDVALTDVYVKEESFDGLVFITYDENKGEWSYIKSINTFKLDDPLAVGANASFNVTYYTTKLGNLTNIVVGGSNESDTQKANNTTYVINPLMVLQKITLNESVNIGDDVTFTIVVTNTGFGVLGNISVEEIEHNGLVNPRFVSNNGTWTYENGVYKLKETLDAGKSASFNITFTAEEYGNLTNIVVAKSNETSRVWANNTTFVKDPKFEVEKITLTPVVRINENATFEIIVTNTGNIELTNVTVNESSHDGLDLIDYKAVKGEWRYENGLFVLDTLAVNETAVIHVIFNATKEGKLNNTVIVKTNETPEKSANNTTFVENPLLEVQKITLNKIVTLDEKVTFIIFVKNTGNVALSDVYVKEESYDGLEFLTYDDIKGDWLYSKANMLFKLNGPLAAGENASFNITFIARQLGNLTNIVVGSSNQTTNVEVNNTTYVGSPSFKVEKITLTPVSYVGDEVIFTIVVTNTGDIDLTDVYVREYSFEGLEYVGYENVTGLWNYKDGVFNLIGDLSTNASFNVKFKVLAAGNLTNIIRAGTNRTDEQEVNNTTFIASPSFDVQKLTLTPVSYVGDEVVFEIIVTNTGDIDLADVYVNEYKFDGLEYAGYENVTGLWTYKDNVFRLIGNLSTNASFNVKFKVLATGNLTNIIRAGTNRTDEQEVNNTTFIASPSFDVQKLTLTPLAYVGDEVIFTIIVTNTGDIDLADVYVREYKFDGLEYVGYENVTGKWIYKDGVFTLVGNLTDKASFNVKFKALAAGNLTNIIRAGTNRTDEQEVNNTTFIASPSFDVQKLTLTPVAYVGDEVIFTIVVTNAGDIDLADVYVREYKFDGLEYVAYENVTGKWIYENNIFKLVGNLTDKASFNVKFKALTTGNLTNIIKAGSNRTDEQEVNNTTFIASPSFKVEKITLTPVSYVGDEVIFTIVVTNTGDIDLADVYVNEYKFDGLEYVGYENVTGKWIYENNIFKLVGNLTDKASFNVKFKVLTAGNITNTIIAGANKTEEVKANNTTFIASPSLKVEKLTLTPVVYNGDEVKFTIVVTNTGDIDLSDVTVKEYKFDGLEYLRYENVSGKWIYKDNTFKLAGNLTDTASFNVIFKAVQAGNITNIVSASSNKTTDTIANNTTEVLPFIDFSIVKLVSNETSKFGDIITWTIIVSNNGLDEAVNVSVTDALPDGLILVNASGNYNNGIWIIDSIPAGENVTLEITTQVNTTNTTVINSATLNDNVTVTNSTVVSPLCDVEITKLVDAHIHDIADEIVWTIIVKNNGFDDALNVNVTDILPDTLSLIKANASVGSYSEGTWIIGTLKAGETQTLTLTTKAVKDNVTITNVAEVNTTTPESNYDNNVAQNTTAVKSKADLSIVKEVSNPTPNLGDIITYTITVTNKGSGDALNVEINDELPEGLVLIMAAGDWKADRLVAGESMKVTLDVLVNKTGEITNTATVTSTEDNKTTNKTVNVAKASDLEVWKIPNTEKIFVGDNLIWTITVKNNGPDAADNVKVSENLPKELQYVSYTATKGTYSKEGVWSVGTLTSGESAVLHITTKVLEIGNITNPINASSDSYDFNSANNHANATVECVNKTPVTPQNGTDDVSGEVEVNGNATGNPIALVVLALISILAGGYRRRK